MESDPIFLHWIIVPIVLPLLVGAALLLIDRRHPQLVWALSLLSVLGLVAVAAYLLMQAHTGRIDAYLLSNWRAPFGIALALDRLSALMVALTAVIGLASVIYAKGGDDQRGPHFHALLQFQLMGLNGAFLTADLFNLFVFFEVLLIASYGLLLHGAGAARLKASIHYVSFNLTGSALFLIAVSMLYGLTGTLNMADLAQRVPALSAESATLVRAAGLMLLVVFSVKAALLPLYFWLPDTYGAATAPVAALFAIMTKVGIYAIARVFTLVFGDSFAADGVPLAYPWLPVLALGTLLFAAVGVLAAKRLRVLVAYLVVASAGTLLLGVGLGHVSTVAAALFYLVPSTIVAAALFLLIDRIGAARGAAGDALSTAGWRVRAGLGVLFFAFAVSVTGMPPLAGFLGKAQLLNAAANTPLAVAVWIVVLLSGLAIIVSLARAGSTVFWKCPNTAEVGEPSHTAHRAALALLFVGVISASIFAGPLSNYTRAAAEQLMQRTDYIAAVLGKQPAPPAWDVRAGMQK